MRVVRLRVVASHPLVLIQCEQALRRHPRRFSFSGDSLEIDLFDEQTPALETLLLITKIKSPTVRPLLLGPRADDAECMRWLSRGMCGIVTYDRILADLPIALGQVTAGSFWFPAAVLRHWSQDHHRSVCGDPACLTPRERQVVQCLVQSMSNKEIAGVLRTSVRTIKFHVTNILGKLQLKSRYDFQPRSHSRLEGASLELGEYHLRVPYVQQPQPVPIWTQGQ